MGGLCSREETNVSSNTNKPIVFSPPDAPPPPYESLSQPVNNVCDVKKELLLPSLPTKVVPPCGLAPMLSCTHPSITVNKSVKFQGTELSGLWTSSVYLARSQCDVCGMSFIAKIAKKRFHDNDYHESWIYFPFEQCPHPRSALQVKETSMSLKEPQFFFSKFPTEPALLRPEHPHVTHYAEAMCFLCGHDHLPVATYSWADYVPEGQKKQAKSLDWQLYMRK